MVYKIIRPALFAMFPDPETAHNVALSSLEFIGKQRQLSALIEKICSVKNPILAQKIGGFEFQNPVGLAAGYDKNGIALRGLQSLGFGFLEMGTITRFEQFGNATPRIFRFPENEAIINRMGFNNEGADKVSKRLRINGKINVPLGISIGKSKTTVIEDAIGDYVYSFSALYSLGDYFAVNVSSPNTPNLRELQNKKYLKQLLRSLKLRNEIFSIALACKPKKIFVKIAPDLSWEAIDEIIEICLDCGIDGLIAVNTTIGRDQLSISTSEEGGLSGKPLKSRALEVIRYASKQVRGRMILIGVGGISTAQDAYEMLKHAHLIQVLSCLPFKGPFAVNKINKGLIRFLQRDGLGNISQLKEY